MGLNPEVSDDALRAKCRGMKPKININDVDLIAYDFDGVMTDNKVIISENGKESVVVNRSDGLAISKIKEMKIPQLILSEEINNIVKIRARKLNIPVLSGVKDKKNVITSYCNRKNIDLKKVVFVGNDISDSEVMKIVGYPIAPQDAYKIIKEKAILITRAKGGEGVIRELYDILEGKPGHGKNS